MSRIAQFRIGIVLFHTNEIESISGSSKIIKYMEVSKNGKCNA